MTTPNKHADLIHAFADGKTLQYKFKEDWANWIYDCCPNFETGGEWRIKPDEPKKAVIATMLASDGYMQHSVVGSDDYNSGIEIGWIHIKELDREITMPEELK